MHCVLQMGAKLCNVYVLFCKIDSEWHGHRHGIVLPSSHPQLDLVAFAVSVSLAFARYPHESVWRLSELSSMTPAFLNALTFLALCGARLYAFIYELKVWNTGRINSVCQQREWSQSDHFSIETERIERMQGKGNVLAILKPKTIITDNTLRIFLGFFHIPYTIRSCVCMCVSFNLLKY